MVDVATLVADLSAESADLDALVSSLDPADWSRDTPAPVMNFNTSVAWMAPMTPGNTPSTPPSPQLGTAPDGGGSGYKQR